MIRYEHLIIVKDGMLFKLGVDINLDFNCCISPGMNCLKFSFHLMMLTRHIENATDNYLLSNSPGSSFYSLNHTNTV